MAGSPTSWLGVVDSIASGADGSGGKRLFQIFRRHHRTKCGDGGMVAKGNHIQRQKPPAIQIELQAAFVVSRRNLKGISIHHLTLR